MEHEVYERVFLEINSQLSSYNLNVKNGSVIDATVVSSCRRPRKVLEVEEVAEDRKEEEKSNPVTVTYSSDIDAKWLKKGHKYYYGYKVHAKNGYFQGCTVTGANESDTKNFPALLDKLALEEGQEVLADKGYDSEANNTKVKKMKLKNCIMKKAVKNRPLTEENIRVNKLNSKRYIIEQNFGGIKKHQGFDRIRYIGVSKCLLESYLKMMSFNIKKGANEFLKFTIIPTDWVFKPIF